MTPQHHPSMAQTAVGAGILLIALALGAGAISIPSAAGYGGIGPNFLPWAIAAVLGLCGLMLVVEARTTGFRELDPPSGAQRGYWPGFAWVTAGLLANAALITPSASSSAARCATCWPCRACAVLPTRTPGIRGSSRSTW